MRTTNYLGKTIKVCSDTALLGGSFNHDLTVYEEHKLKAFSFLLKANNCKTLLDIGASTGSYSLLPLVIPDLNVWSFEPCVKTFAALSLNMVMNGLDKTRLRLMAISDYIGEGILNEVVHDEQKALSILGGKPAAHKEVEQRRTMVDTIDNFCRTKNIIPDAIKIDVEGNELAVLLGAMHVLSTYKPILQVEYSQENANQYGYNVNEIKYYLLGYGYDITIEGPDLIAV